MGQTSLRDAASVAAGTPESDRSCELEGLRALGLRLAAATSPDGLRDALRRSLPDLPLAGAPWVLIRNDGAWEAVAGGLPEAPHRPCPLLEAVAERVLNLGPDALGRTGGVECDDQVCFPMMAGETVVGVLGTSRTAHADRSQRPLVAAIAAVLGLAVRHVRLLGEMEAHAACDGDGLTGCSTRACGMRVLDAAFERARRARRPLSLVMLDLDDFKSVNDRHGHLCGDAVLTAVGARLRDTTRSSDLRCRFGGDEFLVLLPDTPRDGAAQVAEALRREIGRVSVQWHGVSVSTAASLGVACGGLGGTDALALIARADAALYRAKETGRNRVCLEPGPARGFRSATRVLYSPGVDAPDAPSRQRGH